MFLGTSYELTPSDFMMLVVLFPKSKRELLRNNKVAKNRLLQEPNHTSGGVSSHDFQITQSAMARVFLEHFTVFNKLAATLYV